MNKRKAIKENEANIRDLEKKIKQLSCSHKHIEFNDGSPFNLLSYFHIKVCKDCGKTLEWYDTNVEYYRDKAKYHKEQIKDLEEKIKRLKEAEEDE